MGQAWCKEKTNKAQDSKSPLDRVFVRCAHRIYPSLKEEGSVLGGATQRVTSSEIGYAGSPPRDVLTRGRSIDSVDRPFHPSEWVDVNLEVPSTPRASSVLTNLTVDTSLYPATTPTSSCSNLKDVTPVPPPRRRKKNRGRPLPPKPDEIPGNAGNLKRVDTNEEPLYSSVKSPKLDNDGEEVEGERQKGKSCTFEEDSKQEGRRAKEIYEHKVNGTGRIIPSDVVSGNKRPPGSERKSSRNADPSAQNRKVHEDEEYERFARSQSIKDSSTPNHQDRRKSKDLEKQVNDRSTSAEHRPEANGRPKNYSTVSLPNYDELDATRHRQHCQKGPQSDGEKKPRRPVRSSTGSLPVESILSPFSQKTSVLFEDYVPRRGSSEHLLPYQVLGKLGRSENGVDDGGFVKYDPSKLEDWDLSDIGNCELNHRQCSSESPSVTRITGENVVKDRRFAGSEDVVDSSQNVGTDEIETFQRPDSVTNNEARNVPQGSVFIQKPDAFGKAPVSGDQDGDAVSKGVDEWIVGQHRSLRCFDPPTLADCNCLPDSDSSPAVCRVPFFLNEDVQVKANDTIGGSCTNGVVEESERSGLPTSRAIFARSLSNESEPYEDSYESKDLRGRVSPVANLIRTISEESLPREMLDEVEIVALATDDDFFDEKLAKDAHNKLKKDGVEQRVIVKTPPPSPEPKIKAEILDNDHSTLLKVLKDEAHEESNLSSMTPSLTELEAALSDMLEKEEPQEEANKDIDDVTKRVSISPSAERPIEPSIVPTGKASSFLKEAKDLTGTGDANLVDEDRTEAADKASVSLGQILEDAKSAAKGRKVSFCAWEETAMEEIDLRNGGEDEVRLAEEFLDDAKDLSSGLGNSVFFGPGSVFGADEAPEKPSRLHRSNVDESMENVADIPTPPRRRHKNVGGRESHKGSQNGAKDSDNYHTDRLI